MTDKILGHLSDVTNWKFKLANKQIIVAAIEKVLNYNVGDGVRHDLR